uniref:50S ribosomal protein L15e n=1 Tax=Globodera pallida TaxID=36090 RepID=A0A183CDR0_GLOPA
MAKTDTTRPLDPVATSEQHEPRLAHVPAGTFLQLLGRGELVECSEYKADAQKRLGAKTARRQNGSAPKRHGAKTARRQNGTAPKRHGAKMAAPKRHGAKMAAPKRRQNGTAPNCVWHGYPESGYPRIYLDTDG